MKLEVTIKYICDNPRMYQAKENGLPVVDANGQQLYKPIYKIYAELTNTDETFVVEAFRTKEDLESKGIKPGYKGTMFVRFEAKPNRDGGLFQSIRFERFQLNNAGIFNENPQAASGAQPAPAPAPVPPIPANEPAAQQAAINPDTGLPF